MSHDERAQTIDRRTFSQRLALGAVGVTAVPSMLTAATRVTKEPTELMSPPAHALPSAAQEQDMMAVMTRFVDDLAEGNAGMRERIAPSKQREIAMIAYPGMFPLDLLGPLTVFSDLLNTRVSLIWKTRGMVSGGRGVQIQTIPFSECPENLDVLFVPGGTIGTMAAMQDQEVLGFLRTRAASTRYITSVCTGSLVLASAGLLDGYRATSHWLVHDLLSNYGATPVRARVVEDRNRITGAGVTAGLDFALTITARLAGDNYAKAEQLNIEYDPAPPFNAGTEAGAGPLVSGAMRRMYGTARDGFTALAKRPRTG